MSRGEIWWYDDPVMGRRPYLVMTREQALPVLNQVLGVPASRTIRGIPTEVELDRTDGMPSPCALNLDGLAPIRPSLCIDRIAVLSPIRMAEVCAALNRAVDC